MRTTLAVLAGFSIALATSGGAQAAPPTPATPPAPPVPTAAAPAAPTPPAAPLVSREEALKLGRITFERAFAGNLDSLVASADPTLGSPENMRERLVTGLKQLSDQLGNEVIMTSEKIMLVNNSVQYWRTSEYSGVPVPLVFRVIMGPAGKWRGFTANTTEQTPPGTEILP